MGQGYAWEGLASAAFTVNRGNSDKDQLDLAVNTHLTVPGTALRSRQCRAGYCDCVGTNRRRW